MRASLALICWLGLCAIALADVPTFYSGLSNSQVARQIEIRSHVEEVILQIEVSNVGDQATSSYFLPILPSKVSHLAFFQAVTSEGTQIPFSQSSVSGVNAPEGTIFYKLDFPAPLESKGSLSFQALIAYTHTLVPFPAEIDQDDPQLVLYNDNLKFFSAYPTQKESLRVKLASSKVESYTKTQATLKNDELEYGVFVDVSAFTIDPLTIHSENNAPFVTFTKMVREVEISHYGNIAVEDKIELKHTGAKLATGFSRYQYQRNPNAQHSPSYRFITAFLPVEATDIYYRDRIGNISTSHVREEEEVKLVEIHPRFPMFGGWKTDFKLGYNVPASVYLNIDASTFSFGHYILNFTFGSPCLQAAIDEYELRIVFPEHSGHIEWRTPFDVDSAEITSKTTYLDISGRPVLVLRAHNVIRLHHQYFQVSYYFTKARMYQEPILLILAFLVFFVACMAYMRFDISITDDETAKKAK